MRGSRARDKYLCCICLKSGKGGAWTCGINGHPIMRVAHKLRFPKHDASKSKWVKMLSVQPFDNKYHKEQPEYKFLLKTLGVANEKVSR